LEGGCLLGSLNFASGSLREERRQKNAVELASGTPEPHQGGNMKMKHAFGALAITIAAALCPMPATAAPLSPPAKASVSGKITSPVHYRPYRHCHRRHGYRRCHGGYAYYGGPGIYLGFGGRRHHHHHHFRGFRGGGHMVRGPGRMHHGRRH
jgi:hypothetical protein